MCFGKRNRESKKEMKTGRKKERMHEMQETIRERGEKMASGSKIRKKES